MYLYDEVSEAKVVEFIEQWMKVLAHISRYSQSNRAVAQNTRLLHHMLPEVAGRRPEVVFSELHNYLLVGDVPLSPQTHDLPHIGAFCFMMLKHNIRTMRIKHDVDFDDFIDLLSRLVVTKSSSQNRFYTNTHLTFGNGIAIELQTAMEDLNKDNEASAATFTPEQTPGRPLSEGPASSDRIPISPRLTAEQVGPAHGIEIKFFVHVGDVPLPGATVSEGEGSQQAVTGEGESGATLYLPLGKHEIEIHFDRYHVYRTVVVDDELQRVEIDLQRVFDYPGD